MSLPIMVVDEEDRPVGQATKQEVWDKGLIHRIVRIMIENGRGQVLLQHRDPAKDLFPDCWDSSSAGHVNAGEGYDAAALRELEEELGLEGLKLTEIGRYRSDETWHGHRFDRFTRCYKVVADVTPVHLEPGKVDGAEWFDIAAVKKLVRDHPGQVTDGLRDMVTRYY